MVNCKVKKSDTTRTKVESDRLGNRKISYEKHVKESSRGMAVCTL